MRVNGSRIGGAGAVLTHGDRVCFCTRNGMAACLQHSVCTVGSNPCAMPVCHARLICATTPARLGPRICLIRATCSGAWSIALNTVCVCARARACEGARLKLVVPSVPCPLSHLVASRGAFMHQYASCLHNNPPRHPLPLYCTHTSPMTRRPANGQ